ncbi:DUF935 family protein [Pseudomonas aeruginosa]|uniref:phage portal protein family protein n=1 Tax=Pseudomonas aeruginosa TaxID=287 RepID=UPI0023B03BEF|nr:DUF935 family protein [Pseudomonas aeruginosa]MDE8660752.1 DUF935 family protein [Pseudomonas aeruginosa]
MRDADAKLLAKTLSRDLVYPIAVLNGLVDSWARCPRLVFDVQEAEDLSAYAAALPPLVKLGMQIPWQLGATAPGNPGASRGRGSARDRDRAGRTARAGAHTCHGKSGGHR